MWKWRRGARSFSMNWSHNRNAKSETWQHAKTAEKVCQLVKRAAVGMWEDRRKMWRLEWKKFKLFLRNGLFKIALNLFLWPISVSLNNYKTSLTTPASLSHILPQLSITLSVPVSLVPVSTCSAIYHDTYTHAFYSSSKSRVRNTVYLNRDKSRPLVRFSLEQIYIKSNF